MRTAILSDVHANLDALQAVLREVDRLAPDELVFLGDAVGYGPDPAECLDILRRRCRVLLLGNHDAAVVGLTDPARFNDWARVAVEWTARVLSPDRLEFLASLPLTARLEGAFLVHASPHEPAEWHYVTSVAAAACALDALGAPIGFIGHSHVPVAFTRGAGGEVTGWAWEAVETRGREPLLVNVGSVGQPRDGDPRAAFAMWDREKGEVTLHRTPYDVTPVQERMRRAGLPDYLAGRLAVGR